MKRDLAREGGEWRTRAKDCGGGVETVGGDSSETGYVTKKNENKNRRPVPVSASPRTTGIKRRATTTIEPVLISL